VDSATTTPFRAFPSRREPPVSLHAQNSRPTADPLVAGLKRIFPNYLPHQAGAGRNASRILILPGSAVAVIFCLAAPLCFTRSNSCCWRFDNRNRWGDLSSPTPYLFANGLVRWIFDSRPLRLFFLYNAE